MPAARLSRRRRSSLGIALSTPVKPGIYGIGTSPRNVTFAPNVTPGTFIEDAEGEDFISEPTSPTDALFPAAETPAPAASRRRAPPGKRRSQGYIPRPPNAFMLFRANFVRQKHVPGSIETNHGSLSKIIGNCWKALPEAEKKTWEQKAKKAKSEHREMYPNYRFRPVHNKNKNKRKDKQPVETADERRCEEVAQLLLEGKKGEELAAAVRRLDLDRVRDVSILHSPMPQLHAPIPMAMPAPIYAHRRSSSVPPPSIYHPIALPSMNFFTPQSHAFSRPVSPVHGISQTARMFYGQRRASSAGPTYYDAWSMQQPLDPAELQRANSPLSEMDSSLFNPMFLSAGSGFSLNPSQSYAPTGSGLALQISPFDVSSDPLSDPLNSASTAMYSAMTPADALHPWVQQQYDGPSPSASPSAFSGTPPPTDLESPPQLSLGVYASHTERPSPYGGWTNPLPQVATADSVNNMMDEFNSSFNPQMCMTFPASDYSCGLEQAQMYSNVSACAMENHGFSLGPNVGMGTDDPQY